MVGGGGSLFPHCSTDRNKRLGVRSLPENPYYTLLNQRAMDQFYIFCIKQLIILLTLVAVSSNTAPVQALRSQSTHSPIWNYASEESSALRGSESLWAKPTSISVAVPAQTLNAATPSAKTQSNPTSHLGENHEEAAALLSFKAGISGGDMTVFQSWGTNDTTPCGWRGVSCSNISQKHHVTGLNVRGRGLIGEITSALFTLGKLQFLHRLDLSDNNFTSTIAGSALANFSSLALLNMTSNQISGSIPDQIGGLSSLQVLLIAKNLLSGEIPPSIGNCTMLTQLALYSNFLQGHIPEAMGRLTRLQTLELGVDLPGASFAGLPTGNLFSGTIPSALGNCSSLVELGLSYNPELRGQLPRELGQLRNLEIITLSYCSFQDVLPMWMSNLTNLNMIGLSFNNFYGPIPAKFDRLRSLTWLGLRNNNLTGDIPQEIANCTSLIGLETDYNSMLTGVIPNFGNCTSLQELEFSGSPLMNPQQFPSWMLSLAQLNVIGLSQVNLYGVIPSVIGRLSNLQYLLANTNQITGSLPSSLSNCTLLQVLDFTMNNLTGHIPSEIGFLQSLIYFTVSYNYFTGPIPTAIANMTQLEYLHVYWNSLSGTIELDGQWGLLSELSYFGVADNRFTGSIPRTLDNCSNLAEIWVDNNHLTGEIPASFGNLSQLGWFGASLSGINGRLPPDLSGCVLLSFIDFAGNKLEGPIPADLGRLSLLTEVHLGDNDFSGEIFNSQSNWTDLVALDFSYNRFTGEVSGAAISNMQRLTELDISHNFFSGPLSPNWNNLVDVQEIDLSANNLSGSIPNLANLKSLQRLDLSYNNFSGGLPGLLALLPDLKFFNASFNKFVGPVPNFPASDSNITTASFLGNPGLCGGILDPSQECPKNISHSSTKCEHFSCPGKLIPTVVVVAVCPLLATAVVVLLLKVGKARRTSAKEKGGLDIQVNFSPAVLKYSASDILAVIGQDSEENVIGRGAKSIVYKGSLPGFDDHEIAIKAFVGRHGEGEDEGLDIGVPDQILWQSLLKQEAKMQSTLRHRNILKVLSFCSNLQFRALILEYMMQGSLHDHLYSRVGSSNDDDDKSELGQVHWNEGALPGSLSQSCQLSWTARLAIAMDITEGMMYLHHDCSEPLIHGDLKPSNILLDDHMVAKVADFGISKLVKPQEGEEFGEATVFKIHGTIGYMPPEYAYATAISTRGDVFSYGIILLEMLSRKSPCVSAAGSAAGGNVPSQTDYRS